MGRPFKCPYCPSSTDTVSKGVRRTKTMGVRRLRKCKVCGRKFTPKYQPEVSATSGPDQTRSSAIEPQTPAKPAQLDNSAPQQDQASAPPGNKPEQGDAEHGLSENGPSA
jgi:transcription elongation factor Elf1